MDSSAASLLLLFSVNFVFLIIVILTFGVVRRIRGDKAKVKLTQQIIKNNNMSDLETLLLEPTKRIVRMDSIKRQYNSTQQQMKPNKYDWLRKLYNIDELEIQKTCGTDAALYLIYLKYSAILFFIIAFCSNAVLLPLFATSQREGATLLSSLERLTLINAQDRYSMVWVVFFFTIVYSLLGHILLYYFDEKRKHLQMQINEDPTELSEVEVSMHAVLLRGINKKIPIQRAEEVIQHIFNEELGMKLIKTHVIGDYMTMLMYLQKLDVLRRKKEYYEKQYKEQKKLARKQYGSLCWKEKGPPLKDYYAQKPFVVKKEMDREKVRQDKSNFGVAFITIDSIVATQDLLTDFVDLKREIKLKDPNLYERYQVYNWTLEPAPCPSDIIWEDFNKRSSFKYFKIVLLNILLFLVTVILISPISIIQSINPYVQQYYTSADDQSSLLSALILSSITPFVLLMFNYIFIPTLVAWTTYFEEIENISTRHRNNLFKQFFFMMINTVFIPITQTATISSFLTYVTEKQIDDFQIEMSEKFLKTSEFFLKYIIQCTFMTNMVQILDIPHFLYIKMKRFFFKSQIYEEDDVIDDWYFDLGYQFAFSITIFTIVFLFSAAVPLIPLFGFLFFAFKYFIDKYNFVFVYNTEFESRGNLGQAVIRYSTFGLVLYQLIMCGLFTSIFGRDFTVASFILLIGEILYMVVFRLFSLSELRESFKEVLKNENEGENHENQEYDTRASSKFMQSLNQSEKNKERIQLTEKHRLLLKEAYQHPYEKYFKQENAKRQINIFLKKEIKQRQEKAQQELQTELFERFDSPFEGLTRSQSLRSPKGMGLSNSLYTRGSTRNSSKKNFDFKFKLPSNKDINNSLDKIIEEEN